MQRPIVVYGAYGHTGRFVVRELGRRGATPIVAGRDAKRLADVDPSADVRVADVTDPHALDRALAGAALVINCAGPFVDTAIPLIEAALRARIHYIDFAAEQAATRATLDRFAATALDVGVSIVPAVGFYGGLADLLATAALARLPAAPTEITTAIALDRWWPTPGTRNTGRRNTAPRLAVTDGALAPLGDPPSTREWRFPEPFGVQDTIEVALSEIIALHRHLPARAIHTYMNRAPLADLRSPETPPPVAADDSGRSAQRFVIETLVRSGVNQHVARASGRDIYAVTAPLVVEAAERILDGRVLRSGTGVAGELFDATSFLDAASPGYFTLEI